MITKSVITIHVQKTSKASITFFAVRSVSAILDAIWRAETVAHHSSASNGSVWDMTYIRIKQITLFQQDLISVVGKDFIVQML